MKDKRVLGFLIRFFAVYGLFLVSYMTFLHFTQQLSPTYICDPITQHVAKWSSNTLEFCKVPSSIAQNSNENSIKLFVFDVYIAKIIEGCNSISIIILFMAFVVTFKSTWTRTILYLLIGGASIYIVNVFRIAFLAYMLHETPQYSEILHGLVFPAIIYGYVFLLWVFWMNFFRKLS